MVLVGTVVQFHAFQQLIGDVWVTRRIHQSGQPVEPGEQSILNRPRLDLTRPGQRMIAGTRKPPSNTVPFVDLNGVIPPSGQVKTSAPLSVVKMTMVLLASPISSRCFRSAPTLSSNCAIPASSRP